MRRHLKRLQTTIKQEWLVVLDLDRTLFDTARYYRDFLGAISQTWGGDIANSMQDTERTGEHLDPFEYLQREHGIEYDAVTQAFSAHVAATYPTGTGYLFAGASELIEYLRQRPRTYVLIITTGTQQSQLFKLKLCPELTRLNYKIISENKGEVIQAQFKQAGGIAFENHHFHYFVLVDDKADALTPITAHHRHLLVHILRQDAKFQQHTGRADVHEVASLADVIKILN